MFMLSCRSFHILTGIRGACCVGLARSLIEPVYEAGYVSREAYHTNGSGGYYDIMKVFARRIFHSPYRDFIFLKTRFIHLFIRCPP